VPGDELDRPHEHGVRALRLDLFARADRPTAEIVEHVHRMAAQGPRRTSVSRSPPM
jgi:hypothetical protein